MGSGNSQMAGPGSASSSDPSSPIYRPRGDTTVTRLRAPVERVLDRHAEHVYPRVDAHLLPFLPYVEKPASSHAPERRAGYDPHAISVATLRFWLDACDACHAGHCAYVAPEQGFGRPAWLVDVVRGCVVPAGADARYFALSYVWGIGSDDAVVATKATLEALQVPGSLAAGGDGGKASVPRTVADAMELVGRLGERFLWVDRLCIPQDDGPAKEAQLRRMAFIYAGAYCTIVAAEGTDAADPLCYKLVDEPNVEHCLHHAKTRGDRGQPPCQAPRSEEELQQCRTRTPSVGSSDDDGGSYGRSDSDDSAASPAAPPPPPRPVLKLPAAWKRREARAAALAAVLGTSQAPVGGTSVAAAAAPPSPPSPPGGQHRANSETPHVFPGDGNRSGPEDARSDGFASWRAASPPRRRGGVRASSTTPPLDSPAVSDSVHAHAIHHAYGAHARLRARQAAAHDSIMEAEALDLINSRWGERGWTLQEFLFSSRRIAFHGGSVNWECHCASWHEAQAHVSTRACGHPPTRGEGGVGGLNVPGWPNLHRLARIVALFNVRDLTYPEDVADAFEGVLATVGATFQGDFVGGLPEMFWHAAMLWQPYATLVRRRAAREGGANEKEGADSQPAATAPLPSWSWMGWQGDFNSESWRSGYDYMCEAVDDGGDGSDDDIRGSSQDDDSDSDSSNDAVRPRRRRSSPTRFRHISWHTVPTVAWSYGESADGPWTAIRRFEPAAPSFRPSESQQASSAPLPSGWSAHTSRPYSSPYSPPTSPDRQPPFTYYKHPRAPGQRFSRPVPFRDFGPAPAPSSSPSSAAPSVVRRPPYIHTPATRRTRRLAVARLFVNRATSGCAVAILRTVAAEEDAGGEQGSRTEATTAQRGRWAGCLRLNEKVYDGATRVGDACELVELSSGVVDDDGGDEADRHEAVGFDEWDEEELPWKRGKGGKGVGAGASGRYEFYNVMWVERDDAGIARRKAVGRVCKDVWEMVATEVVEVTLA